MQPSSIPTISVWPFSKNPYVWQTVSVAHTDANGVYDLGGLAAGTYRICYEAPNASQYLTECYEYALDGGETTDAGITALVLSGQN